MPAASTVTPAMEQYRRFKRQHPDAILFFRMGDFYEMFYEDAQEGAALLGLTLTKRSHGKAAGQVPLAGVPHHAMEGYLAKLIQRGRKVAICEQVEDPRKAKGVVKREVVQVVSPGTALSEAILDRQRNNYLAAVNPGAQVTGLALVDLSTGDFSLTDVPLGRLRDELAALAPAELLVPADAATAWVDETLAAVPGAAVTRYDEWSFVRDTAYGLLCEQLGTQSLKGFDCDDLDAAIGAGGAAIRYLRDNQQGALSHLNRVIRRRLDDQLVLDAAAQRNLELLHNQQDGSRANSLLDAIDRTLTPMGARLLRRWLLSPLRRPSQINERLDAVEALYTHRQVRERLADLLRPIGDVERLMARICCQRANGRDLVLLARSLAGLPDIRAQLSLLQAPVLQQLAGDGLPDVAPLVDQIQRTLVDDPPLSTTEGGLVRAGASAEVDRLRQVSSGGRGYIAQLQARERERTGIASLKVGFNQVFGYYIEVSKANLQHVPPEFERRQTLVNAERFVTPELKQHEAQVLDAQERLEALEAELFVQLRQQAAAWTATVQQAARSLAQLDVLAGLAEIAQREGYVRPAVDEGTALAIEGGRHPVVERQLRDGRFVPNDLHADALDDQILLVTGPNMAGKSTIIRQLGLLTVMAQMGSFVPARTARIGVVDRVFTRVGAADNLARGESTFMVEMQETANILNNVTVRSLVLIDELGRGTSTYDGLSLAWATVEYLHDQPARRARTLFATHYHELTRLADRLPRVRNLNVLVREEGDHVIFLHRLAPGACDRSYGIHVAQMAGMPPAVVDRANELLEQLEAPLDRSEGPIPPPPASRPGGRKAGGSHRPARRADQAAQLELFPRAPTPAALAAELAALDLDQLTPLEALAALHAWQRRLRAPLPAGAPDA